MFRLQNKATGQVQEFSNRAALLIGLEGEENRCLQLNLSATFQVSHYDKQENLLGYEPGTPESGPGTPGPRYHRARARMRTPNAGNVN